ncbi:MAG: IPT/TIG domain-containing protein, partial [Bryobacteraceae bacterium]
QDGPIARQDWWVYLTVVGTTTPTITSVLNAASFNSPNPGYPPVVNVPASPGEVISIFGYNLGPTAPLNLELDSTGKVATQVGGVQVLFEGIPAPLTYVSATQINCVVPYTTFPGGLADIQVQYMGQPLALLQPGQSIPSLTLVSSAPGIFTDTGTGIGQAAALNSDNTPNSAAKPAPAGSIVQVFMTGEGQTLPAGVTGSVTCSAGCATTAAIPKPVLPVKATVGGQPATVVFYGEAPGLIAGVLQVNLLIPPTTAPGNAPLSITVGSASQEGVTLAVGAP